MTYLLLHHPGCSTSRKGLALLQENGIEPDVRKYMNAGEALSVDDLKDIAEKLGRRVTARFLREKDAKKFELPDSADDEAVYAAMVGQSATDQRPIGINGNKAALGRPIENLLHII